MEDKIILHVSWSVNEIFLSYGVSLVGMLAAVLLNETRRCSMDNVKRTNRLTCAVAVMLGVVGIWCMHYVAMTAQNLSTLDGTRVDLRVRMDLTIASMFFSLIGVSVGVFVASKDPYFSTVLKQRRLELMQRKTNSLSLQEASQTWRVVFLVLSAYPTRILLSGVLIGVSVCLMHYVGVAAQVGDFHMELHPGIVSASVIIAVLASTVALFLIFRILTFYPGLKLQIISAMLLALTVLCVHSTGQLSTTFIHRPGKIFNHWTIDRAMLATVLIYFTFIISVSVFIWLQNDLRRIIENSTKLSNKEAFDNKGTAKTHGSPSLEKTRNSDAPINSHELQDMKITSFSKAKHVTGASVFGKIIYMKPSEPIFSESLTNLEH